MWLKIIILILLAALLVSLGSGLFFLLKDRGKGRRTVNSLGMRITLAVLLMLTVSYGIFSGQLTINAPWEARPADINIDR